MGSAPDIIPTGNSGIFLQLFLPGSSFRVRYRRTLSDFSFPLSHCSRRYQSRVERCVSVSVSLTVCRLPYAYLWVSWNRVCWAKRWPVAITFKVKTGKISGRPTAFPKNSITFPLLIL